MAASARPDDCDRGIVTQPNPIGEDAEARHVSSSDASARCGVSKILS